MFYTDRSFGSQLGFRLPANFRLIAGYTNKDTTYQDRVDAKKRKDDLYSADLSWSGLDFAVLKIGYEKLHRSLERNEKEDIWRYDVAPQNRDTFKASVEISPVDNLSVTLGYKYKKTDYTDSGFGLKEDRRDEVYVDASLAVGKYAQISGYFDYDKIRSYQVQLYDSKWDLWQREKNIDYGIGTDIFIIPKKLTLKLRYDYVRSDGSADFTYLDPLALVDGRTNSNIDINNWDDYRKKALSLKAIYNIMKSVTVTAGYAYEQFKLNDAQLAGYEYMVGAPDSYLTGAYKDQKYNANVLFMSLIYRF
jgi:opacity protein-like surface antigen